LVIDLLIISLRDNTIIYYHHSFSFMLL